MKLKQIVTINAGYPFRGRIPEAPDNQVVAVQMKDVSVADGVQWQNCVPTSLDDRRESDWLKSGDILVAARGNHNYAVHVDDSIVRAGVKAVAAPHFFVLRAKQKNVLPDYLAWFLNQAPCQRYFEQNAVGSCTKNINRNVLEETPVIVPPLAKQQKIVGFVTKLHQEQRIVQQLLHNSERLMNVIVNDLVKE